MLAIISNVLITILDAIKAFVDAVVGSGVPSAAALLILFFLVLVVGVFFIALNGKTGAY